MGKFSNKRNLSILVLALGLSISSVLAIEDTESKSRNFFSFFKREKNEVKLEKQKKSKRVEVSEIELPAVTNFAKPPKNFSVLSIEDCVAYAISHNPNLSVAEQRIKAAKSGIGQERSNYAPRLTARVNYNHNTNNGTRIVNSHQNSVGFNVGISQMIWDFGRTTARINMAKYDLEATQYDYDYDVLNVIYDVRINYYKVLMALANLDIYEQNVRINTLNYERTKAMFDEGLKSKIDVVNAEVNLTDSKIQLVEGQNTLATAIIELKNSMYYLYN